jgi:two-component system, cell cycle response regulator DivK
MAPLGSRVTGDRRRRLTDASTNHAGRIRMAKKNTAAVLVVDDDPDARGIYSSYLRMKGFVVFTGADGRVAIDKAMNLGPDIIVMDLAMPRVDGFEAIRKIRASSWTRRIPIIAISAVPMSQEMALSAGCDAYLTKPVDPEALRLQIMSMLRLSNMPSPV